MKTQNIDFQSLLNLPYSPSDYQTAVFQAVAEGKENILINAVAGSGKTTTIISAIPLIPSNLRILFVSFTNTLVDELKLKISAKNVEISTLHSLGIKALRSYFKYININIDKYKIIVNGGLKYGKIQPSDKDINLSEFKNSIFKLIDLYRLNLCENIDELSKIAETHGIALQSNELELAEWAVNEGVKQSKSVDFTDMVYLPVKLGLNIPKFDRVFIDEIQDLNRCQKELFLSSLKADGLFIAVGDPKQAIYGFAGADMNSYQAIASLPNTKQLALSVSYRCGKEIVKSAQNIVPNIEPFEGSPEGEINLNSSYSEVSEGDMVLCRITAPLVTGCLSAIRDGKKAYVKGIDIGYNLSYLLKSTNCRRLNDAFQAIEQQGFDLLNKIIRRKKCNATTARQEPEYQNFMYKVDALKAVSEGLTEVSEAMQRIKNIFKKEGNGICFSTMHKAKGLEADRVFILQPEGLDLTEKAQKTDFGLEQEQNLEYVAITRAKEYLGYIFIPKEK